MATTVADYSFVVKEYCTPKTSTWALECCPMTEQFPFISETGVLYVRFKASTSEEKAKEIRDLLDAHVESFTIVD